MKHRLLSILTISIFVLAILVSSRAAFAQTASTKIQFKFISESGVTFEQLSAGKTGQGVILYYLSDRGPEHPSIIVRLSKNPGAKESKAEVYQSPQGSDYLPYRLDGDEVKLGLPVTDDKPSIILSSLDGLWVRDGKPAYNLDIQINGPMYAMWGPDYDPKSGFQGWPEEIKPGQPSVSIQVRDPDNSGIPKWDWRTLLPDFPGQGYLRSNYMERKCPTSIDLNLGVSPLWPYVAEDGGFEQPNSKLLAPIVVNWQIGRITHFSELVPARNQNCSFTLYTLDRLEKNKLNTTNFETPFDFYDLSNSGKGYPDLILRTEHNPANDPWSTGEADFDIQRPFPKDLETIRYSWRNGIGDWRWDYKVEVMGFHPYSSKTSLAGGELMVDAPGYDEFPGWVVSKNWPVATFIDTEGNSYRSSEGIYEWSPRELGLKYFFGWSDKPDLEAFTKIRTGFRGEYRYQQDLPPGLYFSPVDHKLHLLSAEGGIWSIDDDSQISYTSLTKTGYVDQWTYNKKSDNTSSQLNVSDNYLVYSGKSEIIMRQSKIQPALFETLPPTNHDEWKTLVDRINANKASFEPIDFKSMLRQFPGPELSISNATLSDYRYEGNHNFRFMLTLQPGFQVQGTDLLGIAKLAPGEYVATYTQGIFKLEASTPANLSVRFNVTQLKQLEQSFIPVSLVNSGLQDGPSGTLELWATSPAGRERLVDSKPASFPGQQTVPLSFQWAPNLPGTWTLSPRLRQPDGKQLNFPTSKVTVAPSGVVSPEKLVLTSNSLENLPLLLMLPLLFASLVALVFWTNWKFNRKGQD